MYYLSTHTHTHIKVGGKPHKTHSSVAVLLIFGSVWFLASPLPPDCLTRSYSTTCYRTQSRRSHIGSIKTISPPPLTLNDWRGRAGRAPAGNFIDLSRHNSQFESGKRSKIGRPRSAGICRDDRPDPFKSL